MSKKFKVVTDCGYTVEYDSAYELGFIVGSKNMKMHNPYEPIHSEYEEFNEGRFDGKKRNIESVTNRDSGWYRIWVFGFHIPRLCLWDGISSCWHVDGKKVPDKNVIKVDMPMVMTPSGELVYHLNEHDPLYNTKQEG
ncbi:MAG: hypothetical protein ACRC8W_09725 [Plesiomonas shigelloides]